MKKFIKMILIGFVGFLVFSTGLTLYETIAVKKAIKEFKDKAVLNEEISIEGKIYYYEVSRETSEFERAPFFDGDLEKPGSEGDIFVTRQAPFPYLPGIYDFVSFYFGGHAAYVRDKNTLFETVGIPNPDESLLRVMFKGGENTHVVKASNYWLRPSFRSDTDPSYEAFGSYYRKEWIGLRVKGATKEDINQTTEYMEKLALDEAPYNFFFVLFTKGRYYCTDMMSRAYESITKSDGSKKFNLNMDGVAVTVNDLILSNDTYIAYFVETDSDGVKHIYYTI